MLPLPGWMPWLGDRWIGPVFRLQGQGIHPKASALLTARARAAARPQRGKLLERASSSDTGDKRPKKTKKTTSTHSADAADFVRLVERFHASPIEVGIEIQ